MSTPAATAALVAALATSAEEIRGYEDVKRANIARFAALTTELVSEIGVRWEAGREPGHAGWKVAG
jgi:acid phosphatase family membrane protein YuiD